MFNKPERMSVGVDSLLRIVATMSCAGTRGAITLAGVLSLPLLLNDGTPFPGRDLAVFIAACAILASLLIASVGLPLLLRDLDDHAGGDRRTREDKARIAAATAAIEDVEGLQQELSRQNDAADDVEEIATRVTDRYRERIQSLSYDDGTEDQHRDLEALERRMQQAGINAERRMVDRLAHDGEIDHETRAKLTRELDLLDARFKPR